MLTRVALELALPHPHGGLGEHLGRAHVDGDLVCVEGEGLDPVTGRDRQRVARVDVGVGDQEVAEHADAVAAHLAQRAVGVAVVHEPGRRPARLHRGRVLGRVDAHHADDAVAADAGTAVAQPGHLLGAQLVPAVGVGDQHEVVLRAVTLDEAVLTHARDPATLGGADLRRRAPARSREPATPPREPLARLGAAVAGGAGARPGKPAAARQARPCRARSVVAPSLRSPPGQATGPR